jgi:hypothetical protein
MKTKKERIIENAIEILQFAEENPKEWKLFQKVIENKMKERRKDE